MPRGSKPGERRGGRQRGTLNKKTLLRNAAIRAVATNPNMLPRDYFLALMRNEELPLATRVTMARKALPYCHSKRKIDDVDEPTPETKIGSPNGVPILVNSTSATSDRADIYPAQGAKKPPLMPLEFLLGLMRSADAPHAIRFKAACFTAPYTHKKKATKDQVGRPVGKPDQFDFVVDRETAEKIRDDTLRLSRLVRTRPKNPVHRQRKATELLNRIRRRAKTLIPPCPTLYGETDSANDLRRIQQLLRKRKSSSVLTRGENFEEARIYARLAAYGLRPEKAARSRIAELEERRRLHEVCGRPPLTDAEKYELRVSRMLFPKEPQPEANEELFEQYKGLVDLARSRSEDDFDLPDSMSYGTDGYPA
jgi:hypothetical protein